MKDFIFNMSIAFAGIYIFALELSFMEQVFVGIVSIASVRGLIYMLKGE